LPFARSVNGKFTEKVCSPTCWPSSTVALSCGCAGGLLGSGDWGRRAESASLGRSLPGLGKRGTLQVRRVRDPARSSSYSTGLPPCMNSADMDLHRCEVTGAAYLQFLTPLHDTTGMSTSTSEEMRTTDRSVGLSRPHVEETERTTLPTCHPYRAESVT
jgi:hypothetical protein